MKIGVITGGRDWPFSHTKAIQRWMDSQSLDALIVGDCPSGVDAIARRRADDVKLPLISDVPGDTAFVAEWSRYGKKAGPRRNTRMARAAEVRRGLGDTIVCAAFPMPGSIGTWDCVAKLEARGFHVEYFYCSEVRY